MRGKSSNQLGKPSVVDLTKDQVQYGIRPSTAVQIKQLEAITAFNNALPKSKKEKQSLPFINSTNVGTTYAIRKDLKKNTTELLTKYTPIGVVDDFLDPKEQHSSKFSMEGKVRNLSVSSSQKKIQ